MWEHVTLNSLCDSTADSNILIISCFQLISPTMSAPRSGQQAAYEHDSFEAKVKRAKTDHAALASTRPQPDDLESVTQSASSDKESEGSSEQDMVAVGAELTSELHRA